MNALLFYLLKVCLCSGVFYLYYLLALRNKVFHQWNRFYLLAIVVLSLMVPLIQIQVSHESESKSKAVEMLQVVQSANHFLDGAAEGKGPVLDTDAWISGAYLAVSFVLLFLFGKALVRIRQVIRKHRVTRIDEVYFVSTRLPQSPFSFMQYIFWNDAIDPRSSTGQQIFRHELVHVKEKHSWDKLFLQAVLVPFWSIPFFWLIRRELQMVHEFIADQKAVENNDASTLAAMILESAHPGRFSSLTQHFFQTPIKRRLIMLSKLQNPRFSYLSRMFALAVVIIVAFAFSIRTQQQPSVLKEPFTVVIDAGHGSSDGKFTGARDGNIYEDEIVLALAKKIKALNNDPNLKIVLARTGDELVPLTKRVDIARENGARLFLSLHMGADAAPTNLKRSAIDIFVEGKGSPFIQENKIAGSILRSELQDVYAVTGELKQGKSAIWVLDKNACPSVLLEVGSVSREKDRSFFSAEENQEKFARKVLAAIQRYAVQASVSNGSGSTTTYVSQLRDTTPKKGDRIVINVMNGKRDTVTTSKVEVIDINDEVSELVEEISTDKFEINVEVSESVSEESSETTPPLYMVDGKEFTGNLNSIKPESIQSVEVFKGPEAVKRYGEKGRKGAVIITLKKKGTGAVRV